MKVLPLSNRRETPIEVASQGDGDEQTRDAHEDVDVVSISSAGMFSREQLEAMTRIENLETTCDACAIFCIWLRQQVSPAVAVHEHEGILELVAHVSCMYQTDINHGYASDYHVRTLYRLAPPEWIDDTFIGAFSEKSVQTNAGVSYLGVVSTKTQFTRVLTCLLTVDVSTRISLWYKDGAGTSLLISVNLRNQHWCGVAVEKRSTQVTHYDLMNRSRYSLTLDKLAWEIAKLPESPVGFVVSANSPLQFNGHSCGMYVCLKFWWHADSSISHISERNVTVLRYQIVCFFVGLD